MNHIDDASFRSQALEERIRRGIEEDILLARLAPGDRLDERVLAQRYGVSRTPVREALRHLASTGLIDIRPRQGARVAQFGVARLMQMFEVMSLLEAQCARLAARRMPAESKRALVAIQARAEQAVAAHDMPAFNDCNWRLHRAIFAGSQNAFLAEQASSLRLRLHPYRCYLLMNQGRMPLSHSEHGGLIDAILAGDEAVAGDRMVAHLAMDAVRLTDFIAALPAVTND